MTNILKGYKNVLCYLDGITMYGATEEEHWKCLKEVLRRVDQAGLTLNINCIFNGKQLFFLDHVVSEHGVSPLQSHVEVITGGPVPTDVKVHSFLWLVGYNSKFILHYARVAEPLRQLLRKDEPFT